MLNSQRFPFIEGRDVFGDIDFVPQLPLILGYRNSTMEVSALLDTGASVNVLPYNVGIQLGVVWEELTTTVQLAGNLAPVEAKGLLLLARVGTFAPVRLVFAWSLTDDVPLLLGCMNFFLEFDVCFYRSQMTFELRPKLESL
ncbi:retroviral-like aspartic protease [Scytonema sp. UIC 10036]|uniref:retroviral-like aspartic protease n=1 Tax=Scytonema sp. UIC 10036 TaxID=2304196 RepID=UPI0012DAE03F|nr:retroviral-like aspartic protease [Scytonema sp. UIC 10036]MUG96388.1 retroviral-like aspartic protease [Scytonema sp. UIC 10036]